MGSFADYGANRKQMFMLVNSIGVAACLLIFANASIELFWWSGVLFVVSMVSFCFSMVFYNAYLPILAAARTKTLHAQQNGASKEEAKEMTNRSIH